MIIISINDINRLYFKYRLKESGVDNSVNFQKFLLNESNGQYLQSYFLMCTGIIKQDEIDNRVSDIISEYRFQNKGNYSYSQLFELNSDWYTFFEPNAWPCGKRRDGETRRGVKKKYVDDIMSIQKIGSLSIDSSIRLYNHIQYLNFCSINKCQNIYLQTKSIQDSGWVIL